MNFIKKNYKKFSFSLIVNIMICLLFNVLFYCRFHTVDDVFMNMIACGGYGKPDEHLIFINVILGKVIKTLYVIDSRVPWYALMNILLAILSLSTILYVFCNKDNKMLKIIIWLIIIVVSYEAYTKIQFTKTAAYLAVSGYIVISYSFESLNKRFNQVLGIFLLFLSMLVRKEMFMGCSSICVVLLLPNIIKWIKDFNNSKTNIINLFCIGGLSFLLLVSSVIIDKNSYSSKEWKEYLEFNESRHQLQDVMFPEYEKYEEDYKRLGIEYKDYILYTSLDYNDPYKFNPKVMESVSLLQLRREINLNEIAMFIIRGKNQLFKSKTTGTFTYLIIILLIYYFLSKSNNTISLISIIWAILISCFLLAYIYYMHDWFDRTSISILFSLLLVIAYFLEPKKYISKKYVTLFCFIYLIICFSFIWNEKLKVNQKEERDKYLHNQSLINEITKDNEHLYLCNTSFDLRKNYYMAYDKIDINVCVNFHPLGDWVSNLPMSKECLKKYEINNPYKDIINNENVYLIGYEDNINLIIDYINRNYDDTAKLVQVDKIGEYPIYSVRK